MTFITDKIIDSAITKAFFLLWKLSDISYAQHIAFKRLDWSVLSTDVFKLLNFWTEFIHK